MYFEEFFHIENHSDSEIFLKIENRPLHYLSNITYK